MKLTKAVIDQATYDGNSHRGSDGKTKWSRCVLWDDPVPGLGLRITHTGKKSFVLSYRAGSRERQMTLGAYGVLTLQQARAKALRALASIMEGGDPLADPMHAAADRIGAELAAAMTGGKNAPVVELESRRV